MGLAEFIRQNIPGLAQEWEKHAASLVPDREFSRSVLRDGIVEMLKLIADEVERPRGVRQRQEAQIERASLRHADDRSQMGIDTPQLLSEFCALRSVILRRWHGTGMKDDREDIDVLLRLNEAIDQIQLIAAERNHETTERQRDLFLAVLGHDLRNPLAAIMGAAEVQLESEERELTREMAGRIKVSAWRMSRMITDLLELTLMSQGKEVPMEPLPTDIRQLCASVLDEMKMANPAREFRLEAPRGIVGEWDAPRLAQVLSNLIGNAVAYSTPGTPVTVSATRARNEVEVLVHNEGEPIPSEQIPALFDSFRRGERQQKSGEGSPRGLGLGLYIAKAIVTAHGGRIDVNSTGAAGTTFICRLPPR
jgi:signal transduction histidine kinase